MGRLYDVHAATGHLAKRSQRIPVRTDKRSKRPHARFRRAQVLARFPKRGARSRQGLAEARECNPACNTCINGYQAMKQQSSLCSCAISCAVSCALALQIAWQCCASDRHLGHTKMLRITAALAALAAATALEATVRMQPVADSPCADDVKQFAVSATLCFNLRTPARRSRASPSKPPQVLGAQTLVAQSLLGTGCGWSVLACTHLAYFEVVSR